MLPTWRTPSLPGGPSRETQPAPPRARPAEPRAALAGAQRALGAAPVVLVRPARMAADALLRFAPAHERDTSVRTLSNTAAATGRNP